MPFKCLGISYTPGAVGISSCMGYYGNGSDPVSSGFKWAEYWNVTYEGEVCYPVRSPNPGNVDAGFYIGG